MIVRWEVRKFDGSICRAADAQILGETDQGTWLRIPRGTPVEHTARGAYNHPCDAITLIPDGALWHATWLTGWDPRLYVDIAEQREAETGKLVSVDLDIDVVRHTDGTVEVYDLDEFEAHRLKFRYPPDLVEAARTAARVLVIEVRDKRPPFLEVPRLPPAFEYLATGL